MSKSIKQIVLYTDKDRFSHFCELLPETQLGEFLDDLQNAEFDDRFNLMLVDYENHIEKITFTFDSKNIQKQYQIFNRAFKNLRKFILESFFRVAPEFNVLLMYPDQRHNPKMEKFWMEKLNELQKLAKNFRNKYQIFLKLSMKEIGIEKNFLKNYAVRFDDTLYSIFIGDKQCALPPYQNEHNLSRAMFSHMKGEAVDWSLVFEEIENFSGKPLGRNAKKDARSIQDAVYALNKRIKEKAETDDDFLSWKNKSVIRNF